MARLISFDLQIGRALRIDKHPYRLSSIEPLGAALQLESTADGPTLTMTRNELATLLFLERAEFVDELEEPDRECMREITDLTRLHAFRIIDWHAKMFLILRLIRYVNYSPKSSKFQKAFEEAVKELRSLHDQMGMRDSKRWSIWTIYHDLLGWRRADYQFAAFQKKGVEYHPLPPRHPLIEAAKQLAANIAANKPGLSAAGLRKDVNKILEKTQKGTLRPADSKDIPEALIPTLYEWRQRHDL